MTAAESREVGLLRGKLSIDGKYERKMAYFVLQTEKLWLWLVGKTAAYHTHKFGARKNLLFQHINHLSEKGFSDRSVSNVFHLE